MIVPGRGEIWVVALDPAKGSEIKKTRPCLVVSRTDYNQKAATVTIIPCSSGPVKYPAWEVELDKTSGLDDVSRLLIPQIRVASKERLKKRIGRIPRGKWHELGEKTMFYLGFDAIFDQSITITATSGGIGTGSGSISTFSI